MINPLYIPEAFADSSCNVEEALRQAASRLAEWGFKNADEMIQFADELRKIPNFKVKNLLPLLEMARKGGFGEKSLEEMAAFIKKAHTNILPDMRKIGGKVIEVEVAVQLIQPGWSYGSRFQGTFTKSLKHAPRILRIRQTQTLGLAASHETLELIIELCIDAKSKWKNATNEKRAEYLKTVYSNPHLEGGNLRYDYHKPIAVINGLHGNPVWWRLAGSNR